MITCTCGKVIDKVPSWIASVKVEFVCNNCPNRQTKNIAFVSLEPEIPATAKLEPEDMDDDDAIIDEPDVEPEAEPEVEVAP